MGKCNECEAPFKFTDVLKGMNPASIKCSGCKNRIKSSYLTLLFSLFIFFISIFILSAIPLNLGSNGGLIKVGLIFLVAIAFEYGYFKALLSGKIKSNLVISESE